VPTVTGTYLQLIEVPKPLLEVFRQWRQQSLFNGDEDFIVPVEIGGPINYETLRRCVMYPLVDDLKIKRSKGTHGFHIWRHTAATLLRVMTGDIETAQKALELASRSTTESYHDHAPVVVEPVPHNVL
jgi:integrase